MPARNSFGIGQIGLGYYPMTLLLARVCLYAGDKDKAYEYASEIVEMVNTQTIYDFTAPGFIGNPKLQFLPFIRGFMKKLSGAL